MEPITVGVVKIVWRWDRHYWRWGWLGPWIPGGDTVYTWRVGIGPLQFRGLP